MAPAHELPVSVKGVLLNGDRVALLENEREEWELPGGKLEAGESPEECVGREVLEELNLRVEVGPLLDAWVYEVHEGARVLILTYGCSAEDFSGAVHTAEHSGLGFFKVDELESVSIPQGYRDSVRAWVMR